MTNFSPDKPRLLPYAMPMIVNLILLVLAFVYTSATCSNLPTSEQGSCSLGLAFTLIILPLELVVFIICLLILGVGINKRKRLNPLAYKRENRISYYGLAIFMAILGIIGWVTAGTPWTPLTIAPLSVAALIVAIFVVKDSVSTSR